MESDAKKRPPPDATTVCFTGFPDDQKALLEQMARNAGLWPVGSVSKRLNALISGGADAGPKKIRLAEENGVKILSRDAFVDAIEKGIPFDSIETMSPASDALNLHDQLHLPPGIFVAIDFETADYKQDSACAIGLIRVENGTVVAEEHKLIRPPREKVRNTHVHGLDWKCLQSQPNFPQVWQDLSGVLDGAEYFIAHNAVFDRMVMEASCAAYSMHPQTIPFLCTLRGAKSAVQVASYALPDLCAYFSIPSGRHHQALSDAKAVLKLWEHLHEKGVPIDAMHVSSAAKSIPIMTKPQNPSDEQDAIREFNALAQALVCDDILNEKEFTFLCEWLTRHDHLTESPAIGPVFELAAKILLDGIVSRDELDEMRQLLSARR